MGQVTAAHVEYAAAKLEAERKIGAALVQWKRCPRRAVRARISARAKYRATLAYQDDKLQRLWLAAMQKEST